MFHKPTYVRINKPGSAAAIPGYVFNAYNIQGIASAATDIDKTEQDLIKQALSDEKTWWNDCLKGFLEVANPYFNKTYTVDIFAKHIKHAGINTSEKVTIGTVLIFTPKSIMLSEGQFTMDWSVEKSNKIEVPDLEEETVIADDKPIVQLVHTSGLDELDTDSLPIGEPVEVNSMPAAGGAGRTVAPANSIHHTSSRHDDKRKIHEARLRVKLAHYKAEKAVSRYLEKYGEDDISDTDSDTTEWETDTSDSD
jgi:hypothetical protein